MLTNQQIIDKLDQIQKEVKDLSKHNNGSDLAKSMLRIKTKLVIANIQLLQAYLLPTAICDICESSVKTDNLVYDIKFTDITCKKCCDKYFYICVVCEKYVENNTQCNCLYI